MDNLQFIASVISSLAWPIVAIVSLLILRRPVFDLVPRLLSLKAGREGLALEFEKLTEVGDRLAASQVANSILPPPPALPNPVPAIQMPEDSGATPKETIEKSWQYIVFAIRMLAGHRGLDPASEKDTLRLWTALESSGAVSAELSNTIYELAKLRRLSSLYPTMITRQQADDYYSTASKAYVEIRNISGTWEESKDGTVPKGSLDTNLK